MNWICKTVIFVSLLIITSFAAQAKEIPVQKTETHKTDPSFSVERPNSSAFIQPQLSYQFAANAKTSPLNLVKWFDSVLIAVPQHQALTSVSGFADQHLNQSEEILLLLYPFHYFW